MSVGTKGGSFATYGRTYEFIITNFAGLYRYRMSDSAEIVGWYNNTPLIKFVGRVDKSVNVSGEKIPESDIEQVVEKVSKEVKMPIFDFSVYPDYEEKRYCFLVEPLPDTNFILRVFADKLQKEMEDNSEKYLVLTHQWKRSLLGLRFVLFKWQTRDISERSNQSIAITENL